MKCPCCGRKMKDTSYTMPCLWEEDYPVECIRYQCKACNVTYESGDWYIPLELSPTEKQINAVSYIISRLNNAAEIPYPATKKNYWEFINKNLEKAKKAVIPWTWQYDTEEEAIAAWNTRKGEAYDTVRPVKSIKDKNCSMCQYFLTGNNNYPCNHCSQGRVNHFKLRFKAGEKE